MEFLLIAFAHFLALLSPGPDFFLILQTSQRLSWRYACSLCGGIAAGNGVYIFFAVTGLESVRHMEGALVIIKYLGGIYLVCVGVSLLRASKRSLNDENEGSFLHVESMRRQFSLGLISALLNPKNIVFYLSLFTVMVAESTALFQRIFYGIWMCGVVLIWDVAIALFIGKVNLKKRYNDLVFTIEKIAGVVLVLFGVFLSLA